MTEDLHEEAPTPRPRWLRWLALIFLIIPLSPFLVFRAIKMVNAQDSDDLENFVTEIQKFNRFSWIIRGKTPYMKVSYRAKIAETRVLQNRLEEAQQEFSTIRSELKNQDSEAEKYVRYYCNYWLATIRSDFDQAEYEIKQASKLSYRSRFIALPEPRARDPLDIAFDQELLEAAEDAGMRVEEFVRAQAKKN